MTKTENIFQEKEIKSLRLLSFGRIVMMLLMGVSTFSVTNVLQEKIFSIALMIFSTALNILNLILLKRKKYVTFVGYAGVFMDSVMLTVLPFIWYSSAGGSSVPYAYFLKTSLSMISVIIIIINGLSLRPVYPLIISVYAVILHVYFFIMTMRDPRTVFSENWMEVVLGPGINPSFYATYIQIVFASGIIMALICHIARKTVHEAVRLEVANSQLGRYFSPNVASEISETENILSGPGGKIQKVTVLFTDIRGFTSLSEKLSPDEILQFLSEYHEILVNIIFKHHGTLDKFIGDAVMATFGTPRSSDNDAKNAVSAALEMNTALDKFNSERRSKGLFEIHHGIGIHTGNALVGNIGTKERLEYTVIGDTVNTANRIESACKELHRTLLFSSETKEEVKSFMKTEEAGRVKMKGKSDEYILYTIS